MNHTRFLVGKLKSQRYADSGLEDLPFGNFPQLIHPLFEAGLIQMLHHQIETAVLLPQRINPNDVGMCECGRDLNFLQKFLGK